MKSTVVFATAHSRLHADIMMIRLRRAGINIERVSAIFSRCFAPNTFFFWLRHPRALRSSGNPEESFFVAGPLQRVFAGGNDVDALPDKLVEIGVVRRAADHLRDSLHMGQAMLCVHAKNKDEVAVALDIFHHSKAENIGVAQAHPETSPIPKKAAGILQGWMPAFSV